MKLIQPQTLDRMFADRSVADRMKYEGACQTCGHRLQIDIQRLSAGFGLLGGALFEVASGRVYAQCARCYHLRQNPPAPPGTRLEVA